MTKNKSIVQLGKIEERILLIRGEKVIIDSDLAEFYGIETKKLNQQVKRNINRFPEDFMFQLNSEEKAEVVTICDHLKKLKFSKSLPYAFTEHGAVMVASVINSPRAVEVSVFIVRVFIKLRQTISDHKELSRKINQLEKKLIEHDQQIVSLLNAIKQLISPKDPPKKRQIGFGTKLSKRN